MVTQVTIKRETFHVTKFGDIPGGVRPPLKKSWPAPLNALLNACWDRDASRRPPIAEVCRRLREMVVSLGGQDPVILEEERSTNGSDDLEEERSYRPLVAEHAAA